MNRLVLGAAVLALAAGCGRAPGKTVRLVTTTSVDNSGLLEQLLPHYATGVGINIQAIAVGSGQAFQIARRGDAALLLTHEPLGERALFTDGLIRYYRKMMFNRFVIAGPAADPAGIASAASARDAMARIARSGAVFVSRGDESGTHVREKLLWRDAGAAPDRARLIETGQGMAATLRVASERNAYVLTDEATLARLEAAVALKTLFAGDPALINTYAVAVLSTAPRDDVDAAMGVARWLAGGDAQDLIDAFRINSRQVFFRWPQGVNHATPESVPPPR